MISSLVDIQKKSASDRSLALFFNAGYEASVALGDRAYSPTKMVATFRQDLHELLYYIASERDLVLSPRDLPARSQIAKYRLAPWGWAPELCYTSLRDRVPYSYADMRQWASRHNSLQMVQKMHSLAPNVFDIQTIPRMLNTELLTSSTIDRLGRYVLKQEFASSGRGVTFLTGDRLELEVKRCQKKEPATRQALYLEHYFDKVSDRGYEFWRDPSGGVTYLGASDFITHQGRYIANRIVAPRYLDQEWAGVHTYPSHHEYVRLLTHALTDLPLGHYTGYIGIDTIVYRTPEGQLYLHPCIEVNVRPTMGVISLYLAYRYLGESTEQEARFVILSKEEALDKLQSSSTYRDEISLPLYHRTLHGALSPGVYPLTSPHSASRFVAVLEVK